MAENEAGIPSNGTPTTPLQNLFKGEFRPVTRKRTPPAWERKTIIGTDRDLRFHTEIKCYVHRPTLQYPQSSLMLQLNNAKSSTFVRLSGTEELQSIIDFLSDCKNQASEVITNLRPAVEETERAVTEYARMQEQIDMVARMADAEQ